LNIDFISILFIIIYLYY